MIFWIKYLCSIQRIYWKGAIIKWFREFIFTLGYILSSDVVGFIARNAVFLKKWQNEDISVGTWLAALKVNRVHDWRIYAKSEYIDSCSNEFFLIHKQTQIAIKERYDHLVSTGKLCRKEWFYPPLPYKYDWKVLPSECCTNRLRNVNKSLS